MQAICLLDIAIAGCLLITILDIHGFFTVKNKSEVIDVFKKFYADTAIIHSKHPLCCILRVNAGETMSTALKSLLADKGIGSESSTPFEPWQQSNRSSNLCIMQHRSNKHDCQWPYW